MKNQPYENAVLEHDRTARSRFNGVWVGAEPTFTLNRSEAKEWLSEALGNEKLALAKRMMQALARRHKTAVVLRSVGRQYAGESRPRWAFGLYALRDETPAWTGPADPLGADLDAVDDARASRLRCALAERLQSTGWACHSFRVQDSLPERILARCGAQVPDPETLPLAALQRPPLHSVVTPDAGLSDDSAAVGDRLFCIGVDDEEPGCLCAELPRFDSVDEFLAKLQLLGEACAAVGVDHLILRGHPPPIDERVAWSTVTPDPAVIEVNLAPSPDLADFLRSSREIHTVAAEVGLTPSRMHYNGAISDSGGGGQITFGGASAERSPFFAEPMLLPRLIVYLNNHPCLSYLFATDYVGAGSQSPRPDESIREQFDELKTALDLFPRITAPSPEQIWRHFAPFMADPSGNSHRSELNIEKLWNPGLPGRGCLGLVEFRALRMSPTAEHATAIAALLRSIIVMLADTRDHGRLAHWGDALHDRFALPFFLRQDLEQVLQELERDGCGLGALADPLREMGRATTWHTAFSGVRMEIEKAIEFWPLVGDVASQERVGSRLVDASTRRLQISLRSTTSERPLSDWQLRIQGHAIPMLTTADADGELRLIGVRYREFKPWIGLHPQLEAQNPIRIQLSHPLLATALDAELHNWQPHGLPYDALPDTAAEADRRREERLVLREINARELPAVAQAPLHGDCHVDLRRL